MALLNSIVVQYKSQNHSAVKSDKENSQKQIFYRQTERQQIELKQFHDLPCRALSSPHTLDSCRWGRHRCRVSSTLQSLLYKWPWFLLSSHWWWNTYNYWQLKMKDGDYSVLLYMWYIKPYRYLWTNTPLKIAFIMFSISSWFSWSWNQTAPHQHRDTSIIL